MITTNINMQTDEILLWKGKSNVKMLILKEIFKSLCILLAIAGVIGFCLFSKQSPFMQQVISTGGSISGLIDVMIVAICIAIGVLVFKGIKKIAIRKQMTYIITDKRIIIAYDTKYFFDCFKNEVIRSIVKGFELGINNPQQEREWERKRARSMEFVDIAITKSNVEEIKINRFLFNRENNATIVIKDKRKGKVKIFSVDDCESVYRQINKNCGLIEGA
jgi:hypothetical protein